MIELVTNLKSKNSTPKCNLQEAERSQSRSEILVNHFPARITVETTAICNLRCVMCPQSIGLVDRPKHMPIELMDRMRDASKLAHFVQLNGIGEPMASPSLWHSLDSDMFHPESEVVFNTNMTILNEDRISKLCKTRFKLTLNISLDAAHSLTYRGC